MSSTHEIPEVDEPEMMNGTDEGQPLDFSTFANGFVLDIKAYVAAEKRYLLMHGSEKAGTLMGKLLGNVVIATALVFAFLFLSIALAIYLGDVFHSVALGFVSVAGIFLVVLGIFLLWWSNGGRDRFILERINDLTDGNDVP